MSWNGRNRSKRASSSATESSPSRQVFGSAGTQETHRRSLASPCQWSSLAASPTSGCLAISRTSCRFSSSHEFVEHTEEFRRRSNNPFRARQPFRGERHVAKPVGGQAASYVRAPRRLVIDRRVAHDQRP